MFASETDGLHPTSTRNDRVLNCFMKVSMMEIGTAKNRVSMNGFNEEGFIENVWCVHSSVIIFWKRPHPSSSSSSPYWHLQAKNAVFHSKYQIFVKITYGCIRYLFMGWGFYLGLFLEDAGCRPSSARIFYISAILVGKVVQYYRTLLPF